VEPRAHTTSSEAPLSPRGGVTARAVVLGLALTPLNVFLLVRGLWLWGGVTGDDSLFINTVGGLFLGAVLNRWLQRRKPQWAFTAGELLTIYVMLAIGTGLTCSLWDVGGSAYIYMTYPFWFASPQNHWQELVWPNLPTWLTVQDRGVLEGFYRGEASPYTAQILRAWAGPALWWIALVTTIMWVALCLNSIFRRRWADEEKLAFPMAVLPVQLADARYSLFTSKLFWIGTGAAAALAVWNTLTALLPNLPSVPMSWDFEALMENNPPWNYQRFYGFSWAPWYLGLAYLIPLDLCFSLFVFGLLWAAQYVVSGHFGWCIDKWSGFPYGDEQTGGGFLALALVALWLDRRFLQQVLRRAVGLRSSLPEEQQEGLSYRTAALGVAGGLAVLWWMLARGRLAPWVIAAFLADYFLMLIVICRIRAQLGAPSHQLFGASPTFVLPTLVGTRALGPRTLGMFYVLMPLIREQRNNPVPVQLEGLKMAEGGRMERRRLATAMAVVPVLALLAYFWSALHVGYHVGMASAHASIWNLHVGQNRTEELCLPLTNPTGPEVGGALAMLFSAVVTLLLYWLKLRYVWWPLHPVAFPIAMSNTVAGIAPALFLTWLVKSLLLRYGGLRAHRTALPFFLGLLAGDATVALLRELVFAALGRRV
jgi:hypothetical protein